MMGKKLFSTHVFVLDTFDASDIGGVPQNSIEQQVDSMKLIACAGMPDKVAVLHMGGSASEVRVDLPATEAWRARAERRSRPAVESVLSAYNASYTSSSAEPRQETSGAGRPLGRRGKEASRIAEALVAAVEVITSRPWSELDLFEEEERSRITIFLGTPPKGLAVHRERLLALKARIKEAHIRVDFVMGKGAYSKKQMRALCCQYETDTVLHQDDCERDPRQRGPWSTP